MQGGHKGPMGSGRSPSPRRVDPPASVPGLSEEKRRCARRKTGGKRISREPGAPRDGQSKSGLNMSVHIKS